MTCELNEKKESRQVMKKACFLIMVCAFMLTLASVPNAFCYPPAGVDHLPSTTATIELEIIGMYNETYIGPAVGGT